MGEVAWGAVFEDIGRRPSDGGEEGKGGSVSTSANGDFEVKNSGWKGDNI